MHEENNALTIAAASEQQIAVLDLFLRNDAEFNRLPYSFGPALASSSEYVTASVVADFARRYDRNISTGNLIFKVR